MNKKPNKKKVKDVKVKEFIIRMTETEKGVRALIIAKTNEGQEFRFKYYDGFKGIHDDLIICEN